jgi:hypothetical protein
MRYPTRPARSRELPLTRIQDARSLASAVAAPGRETASDFGSRPFPSESRRFYPLLCRSTRLNLYPTRERGREPRPEFAPRSLDPLSLREIPRGVLRAAVSIQR